MLLAQRWLLGLKPDRCDIRNGQPTLCWGEKDAKLVAIIWNPVTEGAFEIPVPDGLRVVSRQVAVPRWLDGIHAVTGVNSLMATPNPAMYTFERVGKP